ncbi:hypothetical protein D043_3860B, partial [Vibrio parahaemolyticus EKP-021]
IEIQKDQRSA